MYTVIGISLHQHFPAEHDTRGRTDRRDAREHERDAVAAQGVLQQLSELRVLHPIVVKCGQNLLLGVHCSV